MHRFFVPPESIDGDAVTLSGAVARQLARVLRSRPGDRIAVLDDSGSEYLVALTSVRPESAHGTVEERRSSISAEPSVRIALYQAMLKADRFELVLQKATELGVSAFVPMLCARSVPTGRVGGRGERWRRIITEAAEQSGRGRLPTLSEPVELVKAFDDLKGLALIPWEREAETGLKTALSRIAPDSRGGENSIDVFIGPEGGFTSEEVGCARARGVVSVSLGRRILRAETAAVSAILYKLGELGG